MRLIDADELKEWAAQWLEMDHYYHPYTRNNIPINELEDIIERMPTVDAVPVRHGKWILDGEFIDCSECRREKWSRVPYEPLVKGFKYCPKCGARMDE